jgi:hypothetical protein
VRAVTNQAAVVARRHAAFGEEIPAQAIGADTLRFTGKPRDAETGRTTSALAITATGPAVLRRSIQLDQASLSSIPAVEPVPMPEQTVSTRRPSIDRLSVSPSRRREGRQGRACHRRGNLVDPLSGALLLAVSSPVVSISRNRRS